MAREITHEEIQMVDEMVARARAAMDAIADYDQATVDRLAQAIGWAVGNEKTFTRLAHMSVDESGIGDREGRPNKRFKIQGILRDVLRQPSMGVIEEDPRSEEHTSELQSRPHLVCRLLLEKKKKFYNISEIPIMTRSNHGYLILTRT